MDLCSSERGIVPKGPFGSRLECQRPTTESSLLWWSSRGFTIFLWEHKVFNIHSPLRTRWTYGRLVSISRKTGQSWAPEVSDSAIWSYGQISNLTRYDRNTLADISECDHIFGASAERLSSVNTQADLWALADHRVYRLWGYFSSSILDSCHWRDRSFRMETRPRWQPSNYSI